MYFCVRGISFASVSKIFQFYFGTITFCSAIL